MTALDSFKLLCEKHVKEIQTLKDAFKVDAKKGLRVIADEIFKDHPELESFS